MFEDYPNHLIDSLVSGDYTTPEGELLYGQSDKFHGVFNFVDGEKYPLSLVHPDIPQQGDQLSRIGVGFVHDISDLSDFVAPKTVAQHMNRSVRNALRSSYTTYRRLFGERCSYASESELGDERLKNLIKGVSKDFSHRSLRVLDAGCGDGLAYGDLMELEEVDKEGSVGVTLFNRNTWANPNRNLLYANFMHCGKKREFDLYFSVYGASTYHPTNRYEMQYWSIIALLQSISLTVPGGVIIDNSIKNSSFKRLVDDRVIEPYDNQDNRNVVQVLRHPTMDEVMEYTAPVKQKSAA